MISHIDIERWTRLSIQLEILIMFVDACGTMIKAKNAGKYFTGYSIEHATDASGTSMNKHAEVPGLRNFIKPKSVLY